MTWFVTAVACGTGLGLGLSGILKGWPLALIVVFVGVAAASAIWEWA